MYHIIGSMKQKQQTKSAVQKPKAKKRSASNKQYLADLLERARMA